MYPMATQRDQVQIQVGAHLSHHRCKRLETQLQRQDLSGFTETVALFKVDSQIYVNICYPVLSIHVTQVQAHL